jgi:hypothetical protein
MLFMRIENGVCISQVKKKIKKWLDNEFSFLNTFHNLINLSSHLSRHRRSSEQVIPFLVSISSSLPRLNQQNILLESASPMEDPMSNIVR